MGCAASTPAARCVLGNGVFVDDSIHAMLERDRRNAKLNGQAPAGYRPRAPHPLLQQCLTATEDDTVLIAEDTCSDHSYQRHIPEHADGTDGEDEEVLRILFHTKHHCDTIDSRDLSRKHHAH